MNEKATLKTEKSVTPSCITGYYHSTVSAWEAMLEACEKARETIDIEEFVLDPDKIGGRFIDVLTRKAREGVRVRLILDWFGCKKLALSKERKRLEEAVSELLFYHPPRALWLYPPNIVPRDHRKILITDNDTAFIGGVCIYDEISDWRDTMIRFEGPAARCLSRLYEDCRAALKGGAVRTESVYKDDDTPFTIYANTPFSGNAVFTDLLKSKIKEAQSHIRLTTPYFVPSPDVTEAFTEAAARGVDIEIILSDYSKYSAYASGKRHALHYIRAGMRIYYYKPAMMHLKQITVDGTWGAIGSFNLDGLSILRNEEAMAASEEPGFVQELNARFAEDISRSARFTEEAYNNRPFKEKCTGLLAEPFAGYL